MDKKMVRLTCLVMAGIMMLTFVVGAVSSFVL